MNLQPENVACWQDLSLSFHYRILENDTDMDDLKSKSFTAIRKALVLSSQNCELWNILGVFAAFHQDSALGNY